METVALFSSITKDWRDYRQSRFPIWLFGPVAVMLAACTLVLAEYSAALGFVLHVVLAMLLLFQFRLWDDLADRSRDRVEHPKRTLITTQHLKSFQVGLLIIASINVVLLSALTTLEAGLALLGLCAMFLVWYGFVSAHCSVDLFKAHIVLLKYPAFVVILSGHWSWQVRTMTLLAIIYLVFAVYELIHDRRFRGQYMARLLLALEIAVLLILAVRVGWPDRLTKGDWP